MGYRVATPEPPQFIDASGNPISGGTVEFYLTGTTTPTPVYSDSIGTPLGTSVTLNARGEPQSAGGTAVNIYYDEAVIYKLIRKDADGVPVAPTQDPFSFSLSSAGVAATGTLTSLSLANHFAMRITLKHFGATANGVADDTTAMTTALSTLGANSTIRLTDGTYLFTSEILVSNDRVNIVGDGVHATTILFAPTADGALFTLKKTPATTINQCSIRDLSIYSNDSTYAKTALDLYDISLCLFENISISGSVVFGSGGYWRKSSDASSIGIRTHGRDTSAFRNILVYADRPIFISPLDTAGIEISADHFNFHNCYLSAAENRIVTIQPGCVVTQLSFTGFQAWVGGTGGLQWVDPTAPGASNGVDLENVRYEGSTDTASYFIRIDTASAVQSLVVRGGQSGVCNGIYLRNVSNVLFDSYWYTNAAGEALNVDGTVYPITFKNAYWQTGSTASYSGLQLVYSMPNAVSMPLPSDGLLTLSSTTSYNTVINGTIGETSLVMASGAVASIGSSTQRGFVFITTSLDVSAIFYLKGPTGSTAEVSDPDGFFSVTPGTAGFNVYWDAGDNRYEIENNTGAERTVKIARIGTGQGF